MRTIIMYSRSPPIPSGQTRVIEESRWPVTSQRCFSPLASSAAFSNPPMGIWGRKQVPNNVPTLCAISYANAEIQGRPSPHNGLCHIRFPSLSRSSRPPLRLPLSFSFSLFLSPFSLAISRYLSYCHFHSPVLSFHPCCSTLLYAVSREKGSILLAGWSVTANEKASPFYSEFQSTKVHQGRVSRGRTRQITIPRCAIEEGTLENTVSSEKKQVVSAFERKINTNDETSGDIGAWFEFNRTVVKFEVIKLFLSLPSAEDNTIIYKKKTSSYNNYFSEYIVYHKSESISYKWYRS